MIFQSLALCALSWGLWRVARRLFLPSPLDNIPGPKRQSFLTGNFQQFYNLNGWDFHAHLEREYGGVAKLHGALGEKLLFVHDPKALHHIVVKDQHIYEETSQFIAQNLIVFGEGLFSTIGAQHKKQRKMLNPVFSVNHLRDMIPIFWDVTHKLHDTIAKKVSKGSQEIDMMHWFSRIALELIGQSGLGYSFDPLTEGAEPHPYCTSVKMLTTLLLRLAILVQYVLTWAQKIGTKSFQVYILKRLPSKLIRQLTEVVKVMHATGVYIIALKKQALMEGEEAMKAQIGRGKDIMSILLKSNKEAEEADRMSDAEIFGQVNTLIFAAMDTTSSALARIMALLAGHHDVQEKLREEITAATRKEGVRDLDYNALMSLPYMDAIIRETLRLYPPINTMQRIARKDMVLPLATPIKGVDGCDISDVFVPKDTVVIFSMLSSNRNPAVWGPDAHEWKPERWLAALPERVISAKIPGIYSHLMTFSGGSRSCIGFKFSQLEMKVVLASLIHDFRFALAPKPLVWEMSFVITPAVQGGDGPELPLIVTPVDHK